jgi:hypothetical protein
MRSVRLSSWYVINHSSTTLDNLGYLLWSSGIFQHVPYVILGISAGSTSGFIDSQISNLSAITLMDLIQSGQSSMPFLPEDFEGLFGGFISVEYASDASYTSWSVIDLHSLSLWRVNSEPF